MTNLTGTATFDESVAVPDEGENVTAVTGGAGNGPVRPGFQAHMNRTAALHQAEVQQSLVPRVRISATGADNVVRVTCAGLLAVQQSAAPGLRYLSIGPTGPGYPLDPTSNGGAVNWPASSWVYIYAYEVGGGVGLLTSTTAPDAGLVFKSDDTSRRYLGCFRTDSAGAPLPIPMTAERGVYRYVAPQVTAALGTDTVYTAVALGSFIPPHARRVLMWATAVGESGVGASQDVYFKPTGTAAEQIAASSPRSVAGTNSIRGVADLPLFDGTLSYKVAGGSTQAATIAVAGFSE